MLLCEIKMTYEIAKRPSYKVVDSNTSFKYIKEIYPQEMDLKEFFYVVYLNRANKVIGYHKIGEGGITGVVADIRLIFAGAFECLAVGMILTHNHPTGQMRASKQDIDLTSKVKAAGKLLDIELLDHIIVGHDEFNEMTYYSLADNGQL